MTTSFLLGAAVALCVIAVGMLASPVHAVVLAAGCAVIYAITFSATLKL